MKLKPCTDCDATTDRRVLPNGLVTCWSCFNKEHRWDGNEQILIWNDLPKPPDKENGK